MNSYIRLSPNEKTPYIYSPHRLVSRKILSLELNLTSLITSATTVLISMFHVLRISFRLRFLWKPVEVQYISTYTGTLICIDSMLVNHIPSLGFELFFWNTPYSACTGTCIMIKVLVGVKKVSWSRSWHESTDIQRAHQLNAKTCTVWHETSSKDRFSICYRTSSYFFNLSRWVSSLESVF